MGANNVVLCCLVSHLCTTDFILKLSLLSTAPSYICMHFIGVCGYAWGHTVLSVHIFLCVHVCRDTYCVYITDFSRKLSSATISRKGSTPLSQLRSSSFSMSAMASSDTELEADSSSSQVSNQSALQKSSLMVANGYCNNILNPSLNSSSYHGTADNLQGSSYSVKKCSGQTPSFVEIWHDRLLHHWPVLPPISPQRG